MTPEEFAAKMIEIAGGPLHDYETEHSQADSLVVELLKSLKSLGYEKGAMIFDAMEKW